ncbi:beta-1,3-galactosyltransferase 5-like [Pelodytes ibericus]
MTMKRTCCLKVLLCASAFLCLLLLWCHLSRSVSQNGWHLMFPLQPIQKPGIDFYSLFSKDLREPQCNVGQILIILVTSHPGHKEPRRAIRKTWAERSSRDVYRWQVFFLIGRTLDIELDWYIHKEQADHGDLLMGNYLDTYQNLTLKVMHGMKWAADRCHPHYILKTDDDCFINTIHLPALLTKHSPAHTALYIGSVFSREKRVVIRDPTSKWYVSQHEFQPDLYPPYASGVGYILSVDAVTLILSMAEVIPPIPVEDAYIGILAGRARIRLRSSSRFTKYNIKWGICNYRYLMVIHRVSPRDQALTYNNVLRAMTDCAQNMEVTHWE